MKMLFLFAVLEVNQGFGRPPAHTGGKRG